jgi:hypothetical protein
MEMGMVNSYETGWSCIKISFLGTTARKYTDQAMIEILESQKWGQLAVWEIHWA